MPSDNAALQAARFTRGPFAGFMVSAVEGNLVTVGCGARADTCVPDYT